MSAKVHGDMPRTWEGSEDEQGYRTYKATFLVVADSKEDGPDQILRATGLPQWGDPWIYGNDNRPDIFCQLGASCKVYREREQDSGFWWTVEKTFSRRGLDGRPRLSGGFQRYTREADRDRFGKPLLATSFEQFRGPPVEFEANKPTVKMDVTLLLLRLSTWAPLVDTVNRLPFWGCPPRSIKMEPFSWVQKFDDATSSILYEVSFEFQVWIVRDKNGNPVSGWDRDIINECTLALGYWDHENYVAGRPTWNTFGGDVNKPTDYYAYYDAAGHRSKVILDPNTGIPWDGTQLDDPPRRRIEYYFDSDFPGILNLPPLPGT